MDKESLEVVEHVVSYFKKYLPNDTVLGVGRKSYHPDEAHLYMVLSEKENNSFGFCDCWDDERKILNRGRYGIEFLDSFVQLLNGGQGTATYYAVYSCTDKTKGLLFITGDEARAKQFCEDHGRVWKDEDDFDSVICHDPACPEHGKHKEEEWQHRESS